MLNRFSENGVKKIERFLQSFTIKLGKLIKGKFSLQTVK